MTRTAEVGRTATRTGIATAASRAIGLGRVLVIAAVLGTTYLGNTFQASNSVSNVLFDLLAAGGLSAVLVPAFVGWVRDEDRLERVASGVLGVATVGLGAVALVGVVAAPSIARLLASGAPAAIAARQQELATFLVRWFVPQVVLYGFGAVAAAVLHAQRRFVIVAAAPIANTVVMVVFLGAFRLHAGPNPELSLDGMSKLLLAAAGTGGVVAFVGVLVVPVWRSGVRLLPRLRHRDAAVAPLLAHSGWGILLNSVSGAIAGAVIVAGNAVEGGVVAFQVAFVLFLAPYAVLAQPLHSTTLPEFAADAHDSDTAGVGATARWTLEAIVALVAPVSALLVALAGPALPALGLGLGTRGATLVGAALVGLAIGLVPYCAFLLFARVAYACNDSRTPALVSVAGGVVGVAAIVLVRSGLHGTTLMLGLGLAHSAAFVVAMTVLGVSLRPTLGRVVTRRIVVASTTAVAVGVGAALAGT